MLKSLYLTISMIVFGQGIFAFGASTSYENFYQKGMWHTTYVLMKEETEKEIKKKDLYSKILNEVLENINIEVISFEKEYKFQQVENEALNYLLGKKNYLKKENKKALYHLMKVRKKSSYYPESRLIISQIYNKENQDEKIKGSIKECIVSSLSQKKRYKHDVNTLKYYDSILNNCTMLIGRKAFNEAQMEKSLKIFSIIDKRSVTFISSLLEKSWIYYFQKKYNRTLGLLATFKSPLLKDRFYPEAEYLTILSNYRLCLWNEVSDLSEKSINKFNTNLEQLKNLEKLDREKMLKMIFQNKPTEKNNGDNFTQSFLKSINNNPKFQFTLNHLKKINNEYAIIKKLKKSKKRDSLLTLLKNHKEQNLDLLFEMTKRQISIYQEQINKFENNIIELKIRTLERKKDSIIGKTKKNEFNIQNEKQEINIKENEHFWKFDGEFWADEIGDYSFSIKSNCKEDKKNDA